MNMNTPYRSLPGPYLDLIRDGVTPAELAVGGDLAVYRALYRTAMSARQHGHTFSDWHTLITDPSSTLGHQNRFHARRGKTRPKTERDQEKSLRNAWDSAGQWIKKSPPRVDREYAITHAATVRAWATEPDVDLSAAERAVMIVAADMAEKFGTDRPALPWRRVAEATGFSRRCTQGTLHRLHTRGVLICEERGRPGSPGSGRARASLYRLPTPAIMGSTYLYREERSVDRVQSSVDRPHPEALDRVPLRVDRLPEATETVTLSLTSAAPEQIARVLAAIRADGSITVTTPDEPTGPRRLYAVPDHDSPSTTGTDARKGNRRS